MLGKITFLASCNSKVYLLIADFHSDSFRRVRVDVTAKRLKIIDMDFET
jgi:hypothetical protein